MQAVLFDLDGTLLDPNGSIRATITRVLEEAGLAPLAAHEMLIGMPLRQILAKRAGPDTIEALVHRYRTIHMDETWQMVRFHDGMRELIDSLDVPLAVVTTKGQTETERLLADLGITHRFAAIVGDDDSRPVKPHPAPVQEACRRLGVAPKDAVMVGDTVYDVEAGRAAGCVTVGVTWGHGAGEYGVRGADHVVQDAQQLMRVLRALGAQ